MLDFLLNFKKLFQSSKQIQNAESILHASCYFNPSYIRYELRKASGNKNKTENCGIDFSKYADLSDELLSEVSYVQISSYREKVMKSLEDEVLIPTQISKVSGIRTNHISKILAELKDHELVECINPEAHKGRLYRQTSKGVVVSRNLTTK